MDVIFETLIEVTATNTKEQIDINKIKFQSSLRRQNEYSRGLPEKSVRFDPVADRPSRMQKR